MDIIGPAGWEVKKIYWGDDHFKHWYADLHFSLLLVEKLRDSIDSRGVKGEICLEPEPEFYAFYDVEKQRVAVYSKFFCGCWPKHFCDTAQIMLDSNDRDLLISSIEDKCRELYGGKDCVSVLNRERMERGLTLLSRPLEHMIQDADRRKVSSGEDSFKMIVSSFLIEN